MVFELSVDIAAAPAKVFDFIANFTTMPQWYSAVRRVERIDGTGGLGTRYLMHRDLPGGPVRNEVTITNYVADEDVTFTSESGPTPFVYRYRLEPINDHTRLVLEGSISGAGLQGPAGLFAPMAEGLFKRGMRDNLDELKKILER